MVDVAGDVREGEVGLLSLMMVAGGLEEGNNVGDELEGEGRVREGASSLQATLRCRGCRVLLVG